MCSVISSIASYRDWTLTVKVWTFPSRLRLSLIKGAWPAMSQCYLLGFAIKICLQLHFIASDCIITALTHMPLHNACLKCIIYVNNQIFEVRRRDEHYKNVCVQDEEKDMLSGISYLSSPWNPHAPSASQEKRAAWWQAEPNLCSPGGEKLLRQTRLAAAETAGRASATKDCLSLTINPQWHRSKQIHKQGLQNRSVAVQHEDGSGE